MNSIHQQLSVFLLVMLLCGSNGISVQMNAIMLTADEGHVIAVAFVLNDVDGIATPSFTIELMYTNLDTATNDDYSGNVNVTVPINEFIFITMIQLEEDEIVEDDERFIITIYKIHVNSITAEILTISESKNSTTIVIQDNDATRCSLNVASMWIEEGTYANAEISVECDKSVQDPVFILDITTKNDTAKATVDYYNITNAPVPVSTTSFKFDIPINDDTIVEDTKSFLVILSGINAPTSFSSPDRITFTDSTTTVTIKDDDVATCFVNDYCTNEDDGPITIDINCDKSLEEDGFVLAVRYQNGMATVRDDFTGSGTIDIPSLQTTFALNVNIVEDNITECDEMFSVIFGPVTDKPVGYIRSESVIQFNSNVAIVTIKGDNTDCNASNTVTPNDDDDIDSSTHIVTMSNDDTVSNGCEDEPCLNDEVCVTDDDVGYICNPSNSANHFIGDIGDHFVILFLLLIFRCLMLF